MKRIFKMIFTIVLLVVLGFNVDAACSDTELNDFVEKLKINFVQPNKRSEYAYYFVLSEDKYKGEGIENTLELVALDGDGIPGEWKYQEVIGKYGVGGYTNIKEETYDLSVKAVFGSCKGEVLKHEKYVVPQYNMYIQTAYCEKYPTHKLCRRFTNDTKGMSDSDFAKVMKEYEESLNPKEKNKFLAFILKYYIYVLCIIIPIVFVSLYYNKKIKINYKYKTRSNNKSSKKKSRVVIVLLLLVALSFRVNAKSTCDVYVQQDDTLKEVEGFNSRTRKCLWKDFGWRRPAESYNTSQPGQGGVDPIGDTVAWGKIEAYHSFTDECTGTYHSGTWQNAVLKDAGGPAEIEMTPSEGQYTDGEADSIGCSVYKGKDKDGNDIYAPGQQCPPCPGDVSPDGECHEGAGTFRCKCTCNETSGGGKATSEAEARSKQEKDCKDANDLAQKSCEGAGYTGGTREENKCGFTANIVTPSVTCNMGYDSSKTPTITTYKLPGDVDAFCVNPDQASAGYYQELSDNNRLLDVNSCSSSCESLDCGYSNIMMEALYFNTFGSGEQISTTTVNMAMRLYGAYTDQGGYEQVGFREFAATEGENCVGINDESGSINHLGGDGTVQGMFKICEPEAYLYEPGTLEYVNVYKATVDYILNNMNKVINVGNDVQIDGENISNTKVADALKVFNNIPCTVDGIMCSNSNSNQLKYALALFFNAKQCNEDFKTHFAAVYGDVTAEPSDASISSESGQRCSVLLAMSDSALDEGQKSLKANCKETIERESLKCSKISNKRDIELLDEEEYFYDYCKANSKATFSCADYYNKDNSKLDEFGVNVKKYCLNAVSDETERTVIDISFSEEVTHNSERVDCSSIIGKEDNELSEDERRIKPYCDITVSQVIVTYSDGSYKIYNPDSTQFCRKEGDCDKEIPGSSVIERISACQKSTCYVNTKVYADCSQSISNVTAKISFIESKSKYGVRKFVSCGTTGAGNSDGSSGTGEGEYQHMYAIYDPFKITDDTPGERIVKDYNITPFCGAKCTNVQPKRSKQSCSAPTLEDIKGLSAYTNMDELYTSGNDKVKENNSASYGKSFESSIKDPSLSCIVNANEATKKLYDYTDYFGLNRDICRVYCSDEAHYYMGEKTVVYSGLSFKYDIEFGTFGRNKTDKALTSIISMRRNCVSEIYFYDNSFSAPVSSFASKYGVKDTTGINNWVQLYDKVYDNALKEGKRNELLTKLAYDLYNCNLYSNIPIGKPNDNTVGPVIENVIKPIYANNYGFDKCTISEQGENGENNNTCITFHGVTYDGGVQYASDSGLNGETGNTKNDFTYEYSLSANPEVQDKYRTRKRPSDGQKITSTNKTGATVGNIMYCKGSGCFDYENFSKNTNKDTLSGGEYALPDERCQVGSTCSNVKIDYVLKDVGKTTKVKYITVNKKEVQIDVPMNDYAYFTVNTEVGFYNTSKFGSEVYTGNVYDLNYGTLTDEDKDKIAKVPDYSYPASITTNECKVLEGTQAGYRIFTCDVRFHAGTMGTYYRNFMNSTQDKFYMMLNDTAANQFNCYYINNYIFNDTEIAYRNVNLSNMFPSTNRTIGDNWRTDDARLYRSKIESYTREKGEYNYYTSHLEYSYTLDQDALKKIRESNYLTKNYQDSKTIRKESCRLEDNKYFDCQSTFIDSLEQQSNSYGIINNRLDKTRGVSDYTLEEERK